MPPLCRRRQTCRQKGWLGPGSSSRNLPHRVQTPPQGTHRLPPVGTGVGAYKSESQRFCARFQCTGKVHRVAALLVNSRTQGCFRQGVVGCGEAEVQPAEQAPCPTFGLPCKSAPLNRWSGAGRVRLGSGRGGCPEAVFGCSAAGGWTTQIKRQPNQPSHHTAKCACPPTCGSLKLAQPSGRLATNGGTASAGGGDGTAFGGGGGGDEITVNDGGAGGLLRAGE
eukprot:154763-Chlamydomonas_euryale.AAC.1